VTEILLMKSYYTRYYAQTPAGGRRDKKKQARTHCTCTASQSTWVTRQSPHHFVTVPPSSSWPKCMKHRSLCLSA